MNIVAILPIDCIKEILKIVNTEDICNLINVCKKFKNVIKETKLILNFTNILLSDNLLNFFANTCIFNLKRKNIIDKELKYLKGVHNINLSLTNITDSRSED